MHICIFNPEHDLCLAKGRANYVPPRSAVAFAQRDASLMQALYPEAQCHSVYNEALRPLLPHASRITAWGWNQVVKYELKKRGAAENLLPTDEQLSTIRQLQHRQTILPLQEEAWAVRTEDDIKHLLADIKDMVLKAPWSGAGRGLRWLHSTMTPIDRDWVAKVVAQQGVVIAEKTRTVVEDLALEYVIVGQQVRFCGYSLFHTGSGVYKGNAPLTDSEIEQHIAQLIWPHTRRLTDKRMEVEQWLQTNIAPLYDGPVGIDLMVDNEGHIYVAEMNLRHTMGMVAHAKINEQRCQL